MINSPQGNIQFTWQALWWRLILTGLLLLVLAGSSLTIFPNLTTQSNTQVLPTLTYETRVGGLKSGIK